MIYNLHVPIRKTEHRYPFTVYVTPTTFYDLQLVSRVFKLSKTEIAREAIVRFLERYKETAKKVEGKKVEYDESKFMENLGSRLRNYTASYSDAKTDKPENSATTQ